MNEYCIESYQEKFLNHYKIIFNEFKTIIKEQNLSEITERQIDSFIIQFLNRIMFIYFVQSKGIFSNGKNFLKTLIRTFVENNDGNIYEECLLSLFYRQSSQEKIEDFSQNIDTLLLQYDLFPYFRKRLFKKTHLDKLGIKIPNNFIIRAIFEFFEHFNYTVFEFPIAGQEKTKICPDMIGKTYESLITKDERDMRGVFYTPKEEVSFMCRIALVQLIENEELLSKSDAIMLIFGGKDVFTEYEGNMTKITNNKKNLHTKQKKFSLLKYIRNLKIVDPACGTGVFLVEMANLLLDLRKKLEENGIRMSKLKKDILCNNIYGVDIQNLAINMCELRLWLWFIEEPIEKSDNRVHPFPFFPDLDLNLKVGDSLLTSIFNYKTKQKGIKNLFRKKEYLRFKNLIKTKIKLRKRYFRGELGIKSNIIQLEYLIYQKFLEIIPINQSQKDFLWEVTFIEVFGLNGGFDIVIGNPPYIRQEDIVLPLHRKDLKGEKKKNYKNQIIAQMDEYWGNEHLKTLRNDYFVYFFYLSLHILKNKGVNVFITSNAWLDTQYGLKLQEFLLKNSLLCYIIQNEVKRSFNASINTAITALTYHLFKEKNQKDLDFETRFITIFKSLKVIVSNLKAIIALFTAYEDLSTKIYHIRLRQNRDLWNMAQVSVSIGKKGELFTSGVYRGVKWGGIFFKAPDIYFKILESLKEFPKLNELADVHRGITSNANEFFYIPNKNFQIKKHEQNYILLESRKKPLTTFKIEKKFVKPLFKSSQESPKIEIKLDNLSRYVVIIPPNTKLQNYLVGSYIKWGEKFVFPNHSALRSRNPWFVLNATEPPFLFWTKSYDKRFICFENSSNALADQRFYTISIPKEEVKIRSNVTLFLNSSISAFITEIEGIKNLGEGLLDTNVYWLNNLHIPLITDWECNRTIQALASYELLKSRSITSIYEELGVQDPFNTKNQLSIDEVTPKNDRFSIDSLFADILRLTEDELREIYIQLLKLITNRLRKSGNR